MEVALESLQASSASPEAWDEEWPGEAPAWEPRPGVARSGRPSVEDANLHFSCGQHGRQQPMYSAMWRLSLAVCGLARAVGCVGLVV